MKAIYEPKGAAREYAPLALNLYRGCAHGCVYCYAPGCLHMTREEFVKPAPRKGILETLKKQLAKWDPADEKSALLSFMSDVYMPLEATEKLTRRALELMSGRMRHVAVLTKAADLALRDLDIFKANPGWSLGWTITSLDDYDCMQWEPGAPSGIARGVALLSALDAGVPVWVSVEPVIVPEQALRVVEACMLNRIPVRVGRWNHDARANAIDWKAFLGDVMALALKHAVPGDRLYVKDELAKAGPVPAKYRVRPLG